MALGQPPQDPKKELCRRYVNGEIDAAEFVEKVKSFGPLPKEKKLRCPFKKGKKYDVHTVDGELNDVAFFKEIGRFYVFVDGIRYYVDKTKVTIISESLSENDEDEDDGDCPL